MEFLFAELRRREKTLRIYGTVSDHLRTQLESAAAPYTVVVETVPSDARPASDQDGDEVRCVLTDGERVLGETTLDALVHPLRRSAPVVRIPDVDGDIDGDSNSTGDGFSGDGENDDDGVAGSDSYLGAALSDGSIPDSLGQTLERFGLKPRVGVFERWPRTDVRRLSRELARRASRRADGTFLVGVQWLSELTTDSDARRFYSRLARYGVDVAVCGVPEFPFEGETLPFRVIADHRCDVVDYWFSLYDGAGVDFSKGVVVARQRPDGDFEGYWSYDARTVDWAVERLATEHPRLGRVVA